MPGCGVEVVTGFGQKPFLQEGEEKFDERVEAELKNARRVVYDHERPTRR